MTQTPEWQRLMNAPWGSRKPEAIDAKEAAFAAYDEDTNAFWARRNAKRPTFQNEVRAEADPIPQWAPKLAPAFAEFKHDVRAEGRLG